MNCSRCQGLMCAVDFLLSASTSGQDCSSGWRCIICGDIIDAVIVWNRIRTKSPRLSPSKQKPARRPFRTFPASLSARGARSER